MTNQRLARFAAPCCAVAVMLAGAALQGQQPNRGPARSAGPFGQQAANGQQQRGQAFNNNQPANNRQFNNQPRDGRPANGRQLGQQRAIPRRVPFPPLAAADQRYLDDILTHWEKNSAKVERYRCQFKRWEYDPAYGPLNTFYTVGSGKIMYSAPDKGLFEVTNIAYYNPPIKPGGPPRYLPRESDKNNNTPWIEKWICDGQTIFEFNDLERLLIERRLPPEMRGKVMAEGPFAFMFSVRANDIKSRYWVRPLQSPPRRPDDIWLEAFPKTPEDAANFQKVHIIFDRSAVMPKGLVVYKPGYDPRTNPSRTVFEFKNPESNWNTTIEKLSPFHREFSRPATPRGWKRVEAKQQQAAAPPLRNPNLRAGAGAQPAANQVKPASTSGFSLKRIFGAK